MEATFGWIGRLFEFLGALLPRLAIVEATQLGVAFRRGRHVVCLQPGLYLYWPMWTTIDIRPAVRQTENLPTQALQTADGQVIVVGGMVRYCVTDSRVAFAETHDLDAAVADESLAVICEYVTGKNFSEIQGNRRGTNTAITLKIRSALSAYGIDVERAQLTDFASCVALCHLGVKLPLPESLRE